MRRAVIVPLCAFLFLGACATTSNTTGWQPVISPPARDQAKYQKDLAECRQLAVQNPALDPEQEKKKANRRIGVAAGATMAVATVMTGGLALALAPVILGAGVAAGATQASVNGLSGTTVEIMYKQSVMSCLAERHYHVVG